MTLDRTLAILDTLVAFDTTSRNSNLPLIDWAEDRLRRLGFTTTRIPDATGLKANLLASIGPQDVPGFILSGHTDVVPVDGQDWSSDPFRLRRDGERVYGRGACDMKGFLAVCLAAAPAMSEAGLRQPIHLALSYDEEVGCVGARSLVAHLREAAVRAQACFVGEPTSMRVVTGHKAKRSLRVGVKGRSCHSSQAPSGVNAVEYAALLVAEVRRMAERLAREGPRDPLYDVPHSTGHVGILRGGRALNIVPDACEIVLEFRTIAADDPDALVADVIAHAQAVLEPAMKAIAPEAGFTFDVFAGFPGLDTADDAQIVAFAQELSGHGAGGKVAFGTEAGLFQTIAGVPSVVVGPGSIDQAHKPDEWIAASELESCAAFVDRLVETCRA